MTATEWEAPPSTPRPWGRPITVGVLGGMGPYATLQFLRNVLDMTPATKDWEHVRTVVDSNCHIPSRSRALLFGEASPLPGMIDSCQRLMRYPVDFIALPCNSACHWLPELRRAVKTPVLDIVALATRELLAKDGVQRVTALGGAVPYKTGLYSAEVERKGGTYVTLDATDQERVIAEIERVKSVGAADEAARAEFAAFVDGLATRYRLDGVVLACTEFSFLWDAKYSIAVVDSSRALARAVVDHAVHGKPLELDVGSIKAFWERRAAMIRSGATGLLQGTMLTSTEAEADARMQGERTALLGVLEPLMSERTRMLELGCGTGRWSCVLGPSVGHLDAWDYSAPLVEIAEQQARDRGIPNVHFHVGSVDAVTVPAPYEIVLSVALLHYLDERQFEATMKLVRDAVAPGGHVVFRETLGVDRRFELHGVHSATLDDDYHAVYRTPAEIVRLLGAEFELLSNVMTLAPTEAKPETYQGILVFRRSRDA